MKRPRTNDNLEQRKILSPKIWSLNIIPSPWYCGEPRLFRKIANSRSQAGNVEHEPGTLS